MFCRLFVFFSLGLSGQVMITPQAPVAAPGESIAFRADRPVRWALAPNSRGAISADGVYLAPGSVTAKNQAGPCQLFSNSHIINTRVDTLPVHPSSAIWIQSIAVRNGRLSYYGSFPLNYVADDTPTVSHRFRYTPMNDGGGFWLPGPGERKFQNGEYSQAHADKHLLTAHPRTCDMQELYNPYDNASRPAPCAGCTAASGAKYNSMQSSLMKGGSDAAYLPIYATTLRVEEIEKALNSRGSIQHMVRGTLSNSVLAPKHVWPARANAYPWGGPSAIPYGTILRLKASYTHPSSNPVTQVLIRQLKEYGMIIADGGLDLQVALDDNIQLTPMIRAATSELFTAAISARDFEVVDQSMLAADPASGLVRPGNPFVDPSDYAGVIATDPSTGASVTIPITLRSVAVGVPRIREYIQAGAAPKRLTAWVNGTSNATVLWRMSPAIPGASLTGDGVFTPPVRVSAPIATTVTAVSVADPTATADLVVVVLPEGTLRIATGGPANLKDSAGNTWWAVLTLNGREEWATPVDSGNNYGGHAFPAYTDSPLYRNGHFGTDMRFSLHVPNGHYRVTLRMADGQVSKEPMLQHLESQGKLIYRDVDIQAKAGGIGLPLDLDLPASVSDGTLTFSVRGLSPAGFHSKVSAIVVQPDPGVKKLYIDGSAAPVPPGGKRQLYSVGWFMDNAVTWEVISGPGSIDANGLYTAPQNNVTANSQVVIQAKSLQDQSMTGRIITARITLPLMASAAATERPDAMSVSPVVTRVQPGSSTQFSALMNGVATQDVTWTLSGRGKITGGSYTAPADFSTTETAVLTATSKALPGISASVSLTGTVFSIRVNAGGLGYSNALGQTWQADYGSSGQSAVWSESKATISGADGARELYTGSRYSYRDNDFSYSFSVPDGAYLVTLRWAEYRAADQGYKFDVLINGSRVLTDFNFVREAGGVGVAHNRTFLVTVTTGKIILSFDGKPGAGYVGAAINAIDIVATPMALRINAGGARCGSVTDEFGRVWLGDQGYSGQSAVWSEAAAPISGAQNGTRGLYTCSRYSYRDQDFSYTLAMMNGNYSVTLKWAEYRTTDQGYKFDVLINGKRVLTDFNFVREAGGVRIAHDRTFPVTVTDGKVTIYFDGKPGAGYVGAAVNAIEILQILPAHWGGTT